MSVPVYNDIEFRLEDAYGDLLAAVSANLVDAEIVKSLASSALDTSHVAVICDKLSPSDKMPHAGNWQTSVQIKIVTAANETDSIPAGFTTLRDVHRQRCGVVRDAIMVEGLDTLLSVATGLTVNGFTLGDVEQRIEGHSWITEFSVFHPLVCSADL